MHILHACISTLFMHDQILASYAEEKVAKSLSVDRSQAFPPSDCLQCANGEGLPVYTEGEGSH